MATRNLSRAKGFVHSLDHLSALSDDCNLVILTDRALYVLQNLAAMDATFASRYGHIVDGDQYIPLVLDGGSDEQIYQNTIYEVQGGLSMGCLDELTSALVGIRDAIAEQGNACCASIEITTGQYPQIGEGVYGPGDPPPPGWEETNPELSQKCDMANWYWQEFRETVVAIRESGAIGLLVASFGAGLAILLGYWEIVLSSLWIAIITGEIGSLADIGALLLGAGNADIDAVTDALDSDRQGFVCALYGAETNVDAGNRLNDWSDDNGLNGIQSAIVRVILSPWVMVGLFDPTEAQLSEAFETPNKLPCATGCLPIETCGFSFQYGTGTFVYDGSEFVLSSEAALGFQLLNIVSPCNSEECGEAGNWCLEITATTLPGDLGFNRVAYGWTGACSASGTDYSSETPPYPPLNTPLAVGIIELTSDEPFTVTMKINGRVRSLLPGETVETNETGCETE